MTWRRIGLVVAAVLAGVVVAGATAAASPDGNNWAASSWSVQSR